MRYIREEDIIIEDTKIYKAPIELSKYDMYYIRFQMKSGNTKVIRTFCEKGTFPDFRSEEFKIIQESYGRNITSDFFVKRLIGPTGLMNREGREDYIYLGGELCKNGHIANRYMIQSNWKTAQQNFDESIFALIYTVQRGEADLQNSRKSHKTVNKGKTYVIGDIHGMYGSYIDIMRKMTTNDHLIILGDVIDRGTGGIQIIQDIMRRKADRQHNPKITFLLGNHEMQFLESVKIIVRHKLQREDLINVINWRVSNSQMGYHSLHSDERSKAEYEFWKNKFDEYNEKCKNLMIEKGLTNWELDAMGIWLNSNKGKTTIFDFIEGGRVSGPKEQNDIYKFLCNSYVALPQNVEGRDYLLVHAMPPKDDELLRTMKQTRKGYRFTELTMDQTLFMVQERDDSTYEKAKEYGFTTICGHTPELGNITRDGNRGFIKIDAGCGHKQRDSKLALYCIDDGTVKYYDEKETTLGEREH